MDVKLLQIYVPLLIGQFCNLSKELQKQIYFCIDSLQKKIIPLDAQCSAATKVNALWNRGGVWSTAIQFSNFKNINLVYEILKVAFQEASLQWFLFHSYVSILIHTLYFLWQEPAGNLKWARNKPGWVDPAGLQAKCCKWHSTHSLASQQHQQWAATSGPPGSYPAS